MKKRVIMGEARGTTSIDAMTDGAATPSFTSSCSATWLVQTFFQKSQCLRYRVSCFILNRLMNCSQDPIDIVSF